jgi:2-dehydropantoate 2-reductase
MGAACRKLIETIPAQYSSTAQDLARRKHTEIDYLNGLVVRRGEALGIATPANNVLWALVKLLEAKQA